MGPFRQDQGLVYACPPAPPKADVQTWPSTKRISAPVSFTLVISAIVPNIYGARFGNNDQTSERRQYGNAIYCRRSADVILPKEVSRFAKHIGRMVWRNLFPARPPQCAQNI